MILLSIIIVIAIAAVVIHHSRQSSKKSLTGSAGTPLSPPKSQTKTSVVRLYVYPNNSTFWTCPNCETENAPANASCRVCGQSR